MDKNKEKLDGLISDMIDDLPNTEAGSAERTAAVEDLNKTYKLKIEEAKNETEKKQTRNQLIVQLFGIGVNVGVTIWSWRNFNRNYYNGLKFEETGAISSKIVRDLTSKMFPKF